MFSSEIYRHLVGKFYPVSTETLITEIYQKNSVAVLGKMLKRLKIQTHEEISQRLVQFLASTLVAIGLVFCIPFYYFSAYLVLKIAFILISAFFIVALLAWRGYSQLAKHLFCLFGSLGMVVLSLSFPDSDGIMSYFIPASCYCIALFSIKKEAKAILFHFSLGFILAAILRVYHFSTFRFSISQELAIDGANFIEYITWLSCVAFVGSFILLFNYLNGIATDKIIEQKENIAQILSNIEQGVFTVGAGGKIISEYSSWLLSFFGKKDIAGLDFKELCLQEATLGPAEQAKVDAVLIGIGDNSFEFEVNSHVLPAQFHIRVNNTQKYIELNWSAIVANGILTKLLFTLRDLTAEHKLKEDLKKRDGEFELMKALLMAGIERSSDFLYSSLRLLDVLVKNPSRREVLIDIHTLKGTALTLNLESVAGLCHDIETALADRTNNTVVWPGQDLLVNLRELIHHHLYVIDKYLGAVVERNRQSGSTFVYLATLLQDDIETLASLCQKRGIDPVEVHISEAEPNIPLRRAKIIRNVLGHCLRNSIAHGIESTRVRKGKGKKGAGTISMTVTPDDNRIVIVYKDDGQGLNLAKIHAKGMGAGSIGMEASDEAIAELIFNPDFSTSDIIDEVAGRGIGMDAIRTLLARENGSIRLQFTKERTPDGYRSFELVISVLA